MEREGEESSSESSQAAEEEQSRTAEKRRLVMAVTRTLDSGTLDEKSLRLLEQLADCAQRPRVRSTQEAEPVKQAAAQQATPTRRGLMDTEPAEVPTGEPSSGGDSEHNAEEKVIVGSLRTMSGDRWTCKVPSCTGRFHRLKIAGFSIKWTRRTGSSWQTNTVSAWAV
jgi:D-alanyl-D-alanine carboxypeptidase